MGWGAEMGARPTLALLGLCAWVAVPSAGRAFTVKSGFTDGCHEKVSMVAYAQARTRTPQELELYVPDGPWEEVADYLMRDAALELPTRSEKFLLFSLLTGVRAPDNEGFSLSNIWTLRAIHANPNDQYAHCLRAVDDDGLEGDEVAVQGCRDELAERLEKGAEALLRPQPEQIEKVPFTLDEYGTFEVDVWIVAYHVGRAMHALEDSFTHTLRSADMHGVIHVMNYAEAIGGTLNEERDGLPHSSATDNCYLVTTDPTKPANRDRVFAAEEAAADLLRAASQTLAGERMASAEVGVVLDKWLRYVPGQELGYDEGCIKANDYCDSQWLELARLHPSGPILGCALSRPAHTRGGGSPALLLLLLGLALRVRRAR
jgi:hypothetical protein